MSEKVIPTKINNFNLYNKAERLIGRGDEVPLPDFDALKDTVTGAGILGELDDPTVGAFSNMEMEIPFRLFDREAADMMDQRKAVHLTLRGAHQTTDREGNIVFRPMRVVVRGRGAKFALGKVKAGSGMDSKINLTIIYILVEVDGESLVELDKLNEVFKVLGVDILKDIREMC